MSAATSLRIGAAPSLAKLSCARRWPKGLDNNVKPIRGTWFPYEIRKTEDAEPILAPLIACPRCSERGGYFMIVLDEETRALLRARSPHVAPPEIVAVDEDGSIRELRCGRCNWYGPVLLADWNAWQTLWCAVVKETGRAMLRSIHTHAPDARRATDTIIAGRKDRKLVSIAPVINNGERQILRTTGA